MILTNHRTKEKQNLASASDKHIEPDEKVTSSSNTQRDKHDEQSN